MAEEPIEHFEFEGGKVVGKTKYSLKVELDTAQNSIEKLLGYAMDNLRH